MNCSDTKIGGSNRMELADILIKRLSNAVRRTFKFFIPKDRWPPNSPELNPLDYSIWDNISKHVKYGNVKKFNDIRREVEKAMKQVDVDYVRDVISVFLSRVHSIENHNGELIFDEHT